MVLLRKDNPGFPFSPVSLVSFDRVFYGSVGCSYFGGRGLANVRSSYQKADLVVQIVPPGISSSDELSAAQRPTHIRVS